MNAEIPSMEAEKRTRVFFVHEVWMVLIIFVVWGLALIPVGIKAM